MRRGAHDSQPPFKRAASLRSGSIEARRGPRSHCRSADRRARTSAPPSHEPPPSTRDIMSSAISRENMDYFCKSHLWLAAAALLAAYGAGAAAGAPRRFVPTDSILDIIDTEKVERLLAARRRLEASAPAPYLQRNELDDAEPSERRARRRRPDYNDSSELPPDLDFRKILKSSRNALVVTKKEYLKADWCKTEPLVQKVKEPGCLTATVLNSFCYGQCNSFYIPRSPRRHRNQPDDDERPPPAFRSCSFCRPRKVTWETVTLTCPNQTPRFRRKKIQKIKQCKCLPVNVN